MVYCFAHLHFSVWRNSDALNRLKPIEKTAAITYNNDGCTIFIFPTPPCRNNSNICLWNSKAVDSPRHSTRRLRICSLREPGHPAKAACRESVHRNAVAFSVQFPPPPCGAPPRPALPSLMEIPHGAVLGRITLGRRRLFRLGSIAYRAVGRIRSCCRTACGGGSGLHRLRVTEHLR